MPSNSENLHYVYLIQSQNFPTQTYTGYTTDITQRLKDHNSGKSTHTHKYKPWELVSYTAFTSKEKAIAFESYLKPGSGRAFVARYLK